VSNHHQARFFVRVIGMMVVGVARRIISDIPVIVRMTAVIMRMGTGIHDRRFRVKVRRMRRLLGDDKQEYRQDGRDNDQCPRCPISEAKHHTLLITRDSPRNKQGWLLRHKDIFSA
jgi:hypothetical protein